MKSYKIGKIIKKIHPSPTIRNTFAVKCSPKFFHTNVIKANQVEITHAHAYYLTDFKIPLKVLNSFKKRYENDEKVLNPKDYKSWNNTELCSLLCLPEELGGAGFSAAELKSLHDEDFKGRSINSIIYDLKKSGVKGAITHFPFERSLKIKGRIVRWVKNHLEWLEGKDSNSINVPILSFDITVNVHSHLEKLASEFINSMNEWSNAIEKTSRVQQYILGSLYRKPIIPDKFSDFELGINEWSNHFTQLQISSEKEFEAIKLLSEDKEVGRGSEFGHAMISFIDAPKSGKTHSIFQLANSKPTVNRYKAFFVVNLMEGSLLFDQFIQQVEKETHSHSNLISLLALTVNISIRVLVEQIPSLIDNPLDFVKFIRGKGDALLESIFKTLVRSFDEGTDVFSINKNVTHQLFYKGVKVVFSFDQAHKLHQYAKNNTKPLNDNLFRAIYKQLCYFNNPVFVGTNIEITQATVPGEGRKIIVPIFGQLEPWSMENVDQALTQLLNIDDIKKEYSLEYNMMCYLLSGSPENVSIFHKELLGLGEENSHYDNMTKLRLALQDFLKYKKTNSIVRMNEYLEKTKSLDGKFHLLKLLFNKECHLKEIDSFELKQHGKVNYDFSQAFTETGIANLITEPNHKQRRYGDNEIFDLFDPISAREMFETCFNSMLEDIWKFMATEFKGTVQDFEMFMIMLLIHESKSLNGQPVINSPLFEGLKGSEMEEWVLNVTNLINGKYFTKRDQDGWMNQFGKTCLRDSYIGLNTKPEELCPNGMFYMKHGKEEIYQVIHCFMSLDSDITTIVNNKVSSPNNIGNEINNFQWIISPNANSSETIPITYSQSNNNSSKRLIITNKEAITKCLSRYQNENYYENMTKVLEKFK